MTATNHALTGAVIALAVKKPELVIPLAFLSHFLLDIIPHYNPAGLTRDFFISHAGSWSKKMKRKSFRLIFSADMVLFVTSLVLVPIAVVSDASPWTVFFSMVAGASPDFLGGLEYLYSLFFGKRPHSTWFDRQHVRLQWMERPWGIYPEVAWLGLTVLLISILAK